MNDNVISVGSGVWLVFNNVIYNIAFVRKAVRVGSNVTLTFDNSETLIIPVSLAKEIFLIG